MNSQMPEEEEALYIDAFIEGDTLKVVPQPRIITSHAAGWKDIVLEHFVHPPIEGPLGYAKQHYLLIHLKQESGSERKLDGKIEKEEIQVGDIVLVPALVESWAVSREDAEGITLALKPEFVAKAALELIDPDRIELIPQFARPDPLIYQFGRSLLAELNTDYLGCQLYAQSLANALAMHLVKKYATRQPRIREHTDGLSQYKFKRALDYIHAHFNENITLTDIAEELDMSQYYFSRLFKKSTGHTPYQYIILQRIERAKLLLRNRPELSIAEIALESGFSHQSHLNNYFRRYMKMTPRQYREEI
ncbi:MAG: AraC family transcriptional regulator [Pleurocapsa sp. MO_226.B13]|nr:AraC family transcriptional regulator [Pleurocapsa sp. MO_226.B13]